MRLRTILFSLFLVSALSVCYGQQGYFQIDSLKKVLTKTSEDQKAAVYNQIVWKLRNSNPTEALKYGRLALKNAVKHQKYEELARAYSYLGVAYRNLGDFKSSMEYYRIGLEVAKSHNLRQQIGYANVNIGNAYLYEDNFKSAQNYLETALDIAKELGDERMIAYCELNLGRSLIKSNLLQAQNLIEKALIYRINTNDISGQAVCYKYLADVYHENGDDRKALEQYQKSFNIIDKQFDKDLLSDMHNKVSDIYLSLGNIEQAEMNAQQALEISLQTKNPARIRHAYQAHVNIFRRQGKLEKALEYFEYVKQYNDTLHANQLDDKISTAMFDIENQKQQLKIDSANRAAKLMEQGKKQERVLNYALLFTLLIGIVFLLIILKISRRRKETNQILQEQKHEIEIINTDLQSKNEEIYAQRDEIESQRDAIERQQIKITDSILAAQRIQQAALPPLSYIDEILPNNFVLFMPRDIVSGDFYWARKIDHKIIFTVADCTGHGIPGAFVSMLGMSLINEIIVNQNITDAAEILNKLREQIKIQLRQTRDRDSQDDGMDMSVCVIDTLTNTMEFSGANNPAYIVRNGKLEILNPTLNPIGIYFRERPFEKTVRELQKGDTIYLFSDGYADQFGGNYGRRLMSQNMRKLILKVQKLPLNIQKNTLEQKLNAWRGHFRQVDDISIFAVRIE